MCDKKTKKSYLFQLIYQILKTLCWFSSFNPSFSVWNCCCKLFCFGEMLDLLSFPGLLSMPMLLSSICDAASWDQVGVSHSKAHFFTVAGCLSPCDSAEKRRQADAGHAHRKVKRRGHFSCVALIWTSVALICPRDGQVDGICSKGWFHCQSCSSCSCSIVDKGCIMGKRAKKHSVGAWRLSSGETEESAAEARGRAFCCVLSGAGRGRDPVTSQPSAD